MVYGAFGRWLGHEEVNPMNGISALIKETPQSSLAPSTMWGGKREKMIVRRAVSLH